MWKYKLLMISEHREAFPGKMKEIKESRNSDVHNYRDMRSYYVGSL